MASPPRMLVTAGNTLTPIDAVRGITNVFTGRTGARIAAEATVDGYDVELLTSQPGVIEDTVVDYSRLTLTPFQTFDDLAALMEGRVRGGRFDVVVHVAAVSDYHCAAVYKPAQGVAVTKDGAVAAPADRLFERVESSRKISGGHPELWLRLTPTPKLIDRIRRPWGFAGVLVKFKLEVGVSDDDLITRGRAAGRQSDADLVVANALESVAERAFFIDGDSAEAVERRLLPSRLLARIEQLRKRR